MKIVCVQNRFSNLDWPGIEWCDDIEHNGAFIAGWDFLVYCGPNTELICHPEQLIRFREGERIGVLQEAPSIHDFIVAHPAPLGYPKWSDEFWVLKAGEYAAKFLDLWRASGGQGIGIVSDIVWKLGVPPVMYPAGPDVIVGHCDENTEPLIVWG